ncbi:MAG TPA: argininosuccinate lyase [Gemmatimonadaceae bacterium]|nr:argininosuccinate lyase [Gemmatimonadaceae bacterium]
MSGEAEGGSHKLWGGRFRSGPAPELDAVNRSIGTDFRLWPFDIKLSQAWAKALREGGVLSRDECDAIVAGLDRVHAKIAAGEQPIASDEDVHTMIDRLLHAAAGDAASRLHTGRSRNDQVATASRMWAIDAATKLDRLVQDVQRALVEQATAVGDAVMPAYTHLQRAQPVLVAHWLLSHFWPLHRDRARITIARRDASTLPLGSGAVAGSAFPVPRALLLKELGFESMSQNSIDAVGDRDFLVSLVFATTLTATHLSRLAEDLILFGSSEFAFVRFGDAFSTGSSMMPQKRNPDALELARAASPRMLGDLVSLLGTIKGLPSGYNKDLQEDKRAAFDAFDGLALVLPAVGGTLRTLTFDRTRMSDAVTSTMMATDLADYLVRKGVTFRDAHRAVGKLVSEAEERGGEITALPLDSFRAAHPEFSADIVSELSARSSVAHREIPGGTGPRAVGEQLAAARSAI